MGDGGDAELERLRRAAFARGGTERDLAALADALDAARAAPPVEEAADQRAEPEAEQAAEPAGEAVPPAESAPAPVGSRRAWTVRTAVLGIVALLAGGAGGWVLRDLATAPPVPSVLAAFASLPEAENPWPDSLTHADSRLLGEADGTRFIGTTGIAPDPFPGPSGALVCLWVEDDDAVAGGACTSRDRFLTSGVSFGVSGPDFARIYAWPPDGPPGVVVCAPAQWLVDCPAGLTTPTVPTLAP